MADGEASVLDLKTGVTHAGKDPTNEEITPSCAEEFLDINLEKTVDVSVEGDIEDSSDNCDDVVIDRSKRKVKRKRRRTRSLHDSEDEVSSSDEDFRNSNNERSVVNPAELDWLMWMWYYIVAFSSGAFHVAEYLGEKLADFFGITSPKYQYVIDEYHRIRQEEREERKREERERQLTLKREALKSVEGGTVIPNNQSTP